MLVMLFMAGKMRKSHGNFKAAIETMTKKPHLLIFGPGYSARAIANKALEAGWQVSGTFRNADKVPMLESLSIKPVEFKPKALAEEISTASHWLVSTAPLEQGDPSLGLLKQLPQMAFGPQWIGYLSSTNVYGDHGGAWVDEDTPTNPSLARGKRRVDAETSWQAFANEIGANLHIFRLAGIYGPGRNAVRSLLDGKARRIIKPGQKFSRIHVEDIAQTVWRAMTSDFDSQIFNLADDLPYPPQDVISEAAALMGVEPPAEIAFEDAELSPMAKSFYMESKLVRNERIKSRLGIALRYPSFRDALPELIKTEKR